jgi:hypothetical protein
LFFGRTIAADGVSVACKGARLQCLVYNVLKIEKIHPESIIYQYFKYYF